MVALLCYARPQPAHEDMDDALSADARNQGSQIRRISTKCDGIGLI
jgi:hypothetical protein